MLALLNLPRTFFERPPIDETTRKSPLDDRISCDCISLDDLAGSECSLLNLLGTFLVRPRSKKLPRTDPKQAPMRRAEEEFTSPAEMSRLTSVRSTTTQLKTMYALAFLNLPSTFFERPPDRRNCQEMSHHLPCWAGWGHFYRSFYRRVKYAGRHLQQQHLLKSS